jgi:hypothetical protein
MTPEEATHGHVGSSSRSVPYDGLMSVLGTSRIVATIRSQQRRYRDLIDPDEAEKQSLQHFGPKPPSGADWDTSLTKSPRISAVMSAKPCPTAEALAMRTRSNPWPSAPASRRTASRSRRFRRFRTTFVPAFPLAATPSRIVSASDLRPNSRTKRPYILRPLEITRWNSPEAPIDTTPRPGASGWLTPKDASGSWPSGGPGRAAHPLSTCAGESHEPGHDDGIWAGMSSSLSYPPFAA